MIGYAMDGYGMFELLDENKKEPLRLDENRGYYDAVLGYQYHVGTAGGNRFIGGFRSVTVHLLLHFSINYFITEGLLNNARITN